MEMPSIKQSGDQRLSPDVPFSRTFSKINEQSNNKYAGKKHNYITLFFTDVIVDYLIRHRSCHFSDMIAISAQASSACLLFTV